MSECQGYLLTAVGLYEFVKKGDPPMMGITKLSEGVTAADLKRPRKKLPGELTAHRLPDMTESKSSTATSSFSGGKGSTRG